jgi:hypothetical protein
MTLKEVEKRLQTLEDIEEIRRLHHDYVYQLNNKQYDEIIASFADDGWANIWKHGLHKGKAELTKLFKVNITQINAGSVAHFVVEPVITVDGDKARGYWMLYMLFSDPVTGLPSKWSQGRHDAEYVKINGKWKFYSVKFTRPWPRTAETLPKE